VRIGAGKAPPSNRVLLGEGEEWSLESMRSKSEFKGEIQSEI